MTIDRRPASSACDQPGPEAPFDPAEGVAPCDQLWLTLTNTGVRNAAAGTYTVGDYKVYVDTKGNTQVRENAIK